MKISALILSVLGLVSMILASLIKGNKMKLTLFFVFWGNFLVATSYLLDGKGINGAAACYLGSVQVLINYIFESKNKPLPKWLLGIYALLIVAVNIYVANGVTPLGIWVIVTSLTFIICISQPNGKGYRFWTIVNMCMWCIYDIIAFAFPSLITHVILFVFTVAGMIIHDKKSKNNK